MGENRLFVPGGGLYACGMRQGSAAARMELGRKRPAPWGVGRLRTRRLHWERMQRGPGDRQGARAGRRMALLRIATGITGRRHRKPSPERERIWADAWSSTGGIPQRVCLPSLSRICRKPASFRGAAPISALFVPAQGGPSWAGQPSAGPNGGRNGPMVSNVTAPFQAKRRRKRRRWLVVFSRG